MKKTTINKKIAEDMKDTILIASSLSTYHCCVMYYRFSDISSITWKQVNDDLRDKCPSVVALIDMVLSLPASSAEAERGFSLMKIIKTDWRSRLTDDSVSDLMTIKFDSPDVKDFDPQPAIDVWLLKKRMLYFSDNRTRLRREEDDRPAEIPGDHDAHVCVEAQQEVQTADDGDLSDYYSDDKLVTDDKLIDQENKAYEMLTSMF